MGLSSHFFMGEIWPWSSWCCNGDALEQVLEQLALQLSQSCHITVLTVGFGFHWGSIVFPLEQGDSQQDDLLGKTLIDHLLLSPCSSSCLQIHDHQFMEYNRYVQRSYGVGQASALSYTSQNHRMMRLEGISGVYLILPSV